MRQAAALPPDSDLLRASDETAGASLSLSEDLKHWHLHGRQNYQLNVIATGGQSG